MHQRLISFPALTKAANAHGNQLYDVRHYDLPLKVGTGKPRKGKRLLTVGTDCSVGKMYTSLALEKEMNRQGFIANFAQPDKPVF